MALNPIYPYLPLLASIKYKIVKRRIQWLIIIAMLSQNQNIKKIIGKKQKLGEVEKYRQWWYKHN